MRVYYEALFNCLFFQSVTDLSRWYEIAYGVMAWANIAIIIYACLGLSKLN